MHLITPSLLNIIVYSLAFLQRAQNTYINQSWKNHLTESLFYNEVFSILCHL